MPKAYHCGQHIKTVDGHEGEIVTVRWDKDLDLVRWLEIRTERGDLIGVRPNEVSG